MNPRALILVLTLIPSCTGKDKAEKASLPAASAPSASNVAAETSSSPAKPTEPSPVAAAIPEGTATDLDTPKLQTDSQNSRGLAARLTGAVEAARQAQLSFKVPGHIEKIAVKEGDFVKSGTLLAHLELHDFQLRFEQAQARIELARIGSVQAQKDLDREAELLKSNVATDVSYDRAVNTKNQAVLNLRLAELDATTARRALEDAKLIAPYDIVVSQINFEENEFVRDGTAVLAVFDLAQPEIKLSAPEQMLGQFSIGDVLTVTVPAAKFAGKAEISRIVPVVSLQTRTFTIYAKIATENSLAPGSYAEATKE